MVLIFSWFKIVRGIEIFVSQECSVAVNPGAKKQREQLAGFPLLCVPQHILAKWQKMQERNKD